MSIRYKLVLKPNTVVPETGLRTLNELLTNQPLMDSSGNIDMSANYLLVKNIEVGTQDFTTNAEKGIINIFSDSSNNNTSCINFKHDTNNIGGINRQYCSFQPNDTNFISGSIIGNSGSVSYNTTSDERAKNLVIDNNIVDNISRFTSASNGAYNSYILSSETNPSIGNVTFASWLDSVNALHPVIYQFKGDVVPDTSFNYDLNLNNRIETRSVNYQGFFAGDVQAVYPPAVSGMRNHIDSSGNPIYQQLDMTKLIPMMVGAIQDLSSKVSTLEASINDMNARISPNMKYTTTNGLLSYTINNTNAIYDSNDYYQPIKYAIEKWDSLVRIPTIYTTNNNYNYTILNININFSELGENILGSAYITEITSPGDSSGNPYGNTFATSGVFELNTSYLTIMKNNTYSNGFTQLYYTALHEIGHILGIGPFWVLTDYISNIPKTSYQENGVTKYYYTGENAVREYKSYFPDNISNNYIGIPLEDDGGNGTQNVHPEEGLQGSISAETRDISGVTYYGLNDELMTGWSESTVAMPLSRVTLGFLQDIGYDVSYSLADDYTAKYP